MPTSTLVFKRIGTDEDVILFDVKRSFQSGWYEGDVFEEFSERIGDTIRGVILWDARQPLIFWLDKQGKPVNRDANNGVAYNAKKLGNIFDTPELVDPILLLRLGYPSTKEPEAESQEVQTPELLPELIQEPVKIE